jgi:hypothetical protein
MELSGFTTETQRSRREDFFVCRGGADRQKPSVWNKFPWPKAREFMENRYLAILHENTSLSVLPAYRQAGVSRTSPVWWDEWVVKIVLNVNYFLLLVINTV